MLASWLLLVLDFEATCDNKTSVLPKEEIEIIEFPTILYDIKNELVQATFHQYVRPTIHPNLTQFCTDLTGIQQATVDAAQPFPVVWESFQEFLRNHDITTQPDDACFLTCGDWDLKTMLPAQLRLSGLRDASASPAAPAKPFDRWINIKNSYRRLYGLKYPKGMQGMLNHANMDLEGRHHSGIDDCKNILRLVRKMRTDGWSPQDEVPSR
ncbi:exonuclease RNase T and DNA polymerase III [Lenzites betulinus]|nr:exonuclease RNase T and DNA polymerase III [Lenzites betulinus]